VRPEVLGPTLDKLEELRRLALEESQVQNLDNSQGGQVNNLLFIELLSFVLEKLKNHFEKFKRSPFFVELTQEISR
jgi:hypothetical protein